MPDSPCVNAGNPALEYNDPDGSRNNIGDPGGPSGFNTPGSGDHTIEDDAISVEFHNLSQGGWTTVEKIEDVDPYDLPNITLDFIMELGA